MCVCVYIYMYVYMYIYIPYFMDHRLENYYRLMPELDFPGDSVVKNLPANAVDVRDVCLIPMLGRSPGEEHSNPFLYSCLENPIDRGVW